MALSKDGGETRRRIICHVRGKMRSSLNSKDIFLLLREALGYQERKDRLSTRRCKWLGPTRSRGSKFQICFKEAVCWTVGSLVLRDRTEFRSALSAILRNLALEYVRYCLSVEEKKRLEKSVD